MDERGDINRKTYDQCTERRPTYLCTHSICIENDETLTKSWDKVPPCTPTSEFDFAHKSESLPSALPNLENIEIPMVREIGVKACMDELADAFGCNNYKTSYVHFWYLDVIIDCIWRCQDDYEFPVEQQKIILGWLLFMLHIIQDPSQNLSRREFLALFRELVYVGAELLDEGNYNVPLPLQLVTLLPDNVSIKTQDNGNGEQDQNASTVSPQDVSTNDNGSYYQLPKDQEATPEEKELVYVTSKDTCHCSSFLSNLTSESSTTTSYSKESTTVTEECSQTTLESIKELYKPDPNTPPRFLPLSSATELFRNTRTTLTRTVSAELCANDEKALMENLGKELDKTSSSCSHTVIKIDEEYIQSLKKGNYYIVFQKVASSADIVKNNEIAEETAGKTVGIDETDPVGIKEDFKDEDVRKESIMKKLTRFKILEQRMKDADDSKVGLESWQCEETEESQTIDEKISVKTTAAENCEKEKLRLLINEIEMEMLEEKKLYAFGVLWVLIDFIHDYFNSDFQYTLIKMALNSPPDMIVQNVEDEMKIPKDLKDDLTVYVKDLADKYKVKECKEEKVKGKKEKQKKEKKPPKEKKQKDKSKKDKMSKSERRELERQRKEELKRQKQLEAELEAERIRKEMNRIYMFPLQDGVDLDFFKTRFENWKVVDIRKKLKKKK